MRLIQQSGIAQGGHYIADGCRAHAVLIAKLTGNDLRRHRLAGRDVVFDDACKPSRSRGLIRRSETMGYIVFLV